MGCPTPTPPPTACAILVDLENLVLSAPARPDEQDIRHLLAAVLGQVPVLGRAAAGHGLAREFAWSLKSLGIRTSRHRGGQDAADRILEAAASEIPARCDRLVIASGDHLFTSAALQHRNHRTVEVVAWRGSLSRSLAAAAHSVTYLDSTARSEAA